MKTYLLITPDGDKWVYNTRDEAERTRYIFGGTIIEQEEQEEQEGESK